MTRLQQRALARLPLEQAIVEGINATAMKADPTTTFYPLPRGIILALCESHERLRAELEGATILLEEKP